MLSINQKCVCGLSTLICLWTEIQKGNSSRKKAERLWREWDRIYTPYQFTNNNLEKNSLLKDIYTHMYMHIFVYMYIHTYTYDYVCIYMCVHVCVCVRQLLSHLWLFAIPWTLYSQAPLSMEFSRQEYWSE